MSEARLSPRRTRQGTFVLADHRGRLRGATLVMAIVLSLFAGRLLQLQGLDASAYAQAAESTRIRTQELPAVRGSITDVHGVALATSVESRNVTADQVLIAESSAGPRGAAEKLAPVLGLDVEALTELLTGDDRFVFVAKGITPELWRTVSELGVVGIFSESDSERTYPAGELAANVVGFIGEEGQGMAGLEYTLEERLTGVDGKRTYQRGPDGRRIATAESTLLEPVPGDDVRLTLDRDIQWAAQNAIAAATEKFQAESGSVVAYDVRTGDILAMATVPTLDPNEAGSAEEVELGNRVVADAYEPGSTGKVLTAAALIEEGAVTPSTPVQVPARLSRAGKSFKDWEVARSSNMTYAGTLARSSNIGTILAAEELGIEKLPPYFEAFGLGQPTGLGLPGENPGAVRPVEDWSGTTGYTMTFGQGYSVNLVQMASVFATVANGGVRVEPRIVDGWTDAAGTWHAAPASGEHRVVSEQTATTVAEMMEGVITEGGTAPGAAVPGYRVAGKTGTAQRYVEGCGYCGFTMSFMGFAPADDPQIAVAVVLQEPQGSTGGGSSAGPVFAEVMSFALQSRRVPPSGSASPMLPLTTDG